jgi:hypothetical protein
VVGSCKGKKGEQGREWVSTPSLAQASNLLKQSFSMKQVKLVVGNTSAGIYKDMKPQVYVDISKVRECEMVIDFGTRFSSCLICHCIGFVTHV